VFAIIGATCTAGTVPVDVIIGNEGGGTVVGIDGML